MATSTFTEFCENILIVLYQDGHDSDEFLQLEPLQRKYGLYGPPSWLSRAMNHLKAQRRVEGRELAGAPDTVKARITGSGMAYIEEKYESKDGVGNVISPVDETMDVTVEEDEIDDAIVVDSSTWTGLPSNFTLNEEKRNRLGRLLQDAEIELDSIGAGNSEKSMARAYIMAAKSLADAPEPQVDLIWAIIQRANNLAGIASLFVSIIALFTTVMH